MENDFLNKITQIIEENLSDERFGVSELANKIGMSRSNLLRKVKKLNGQSVSQFIRKVRLENAMEMLKENDQTVSEVSYEVGFGSTSYFVKCFHDQYGYPPGEVSKKNLEENENVEASKDSNESVVGLSQMAKFWKELKRRKVMKVIIVYASMSFVVLELLSILIEPLFLPDWVMTLVIVLLALGFPIVIVFSWIFDITPSGIEVTQSLNQNGNQTNEADNRKKSFLYAALVGVLLVVVVMLAYPKVFKSDEARLNTDLEKSIAVLPFKNDSNDAANVYIVNGLMESVLNNLQKIEDLRVISRTSVEKFRNNTKTISEIAKELNVSYFVEGSGQKIDDEILLNIQLIEASSDKHLWAQQYKRKATDIFDLQKEVAKNIAGKIEAIITPEEAARIDKVPTDNLTAYDYFLKGLDLFYLGNREGLEAAIPLFKKAIEYDTKFSRAYADIAISYYYLEVLQAEKQYTAQINEYADKALLYDSKCAQSLIAKALYHMNSAEYVQALPYFEKALEYNPNSAIVIQLLSEFYTSYMPDTEKYLEYALKGVQLDIASHDSITASYIYLHLSNAFIQSGFVEEAEKHINRSLAYSPENIFSQYVKAYVLYAKNQDLAQTKKLLLETYAKDTTRLDVLQEVAKICYYQRDFEDAYTYYDKFTTIKETQQLDIFPSEDSKIGVVFDKMGLKTKSEQYFTKYLNYAENDNSVYKDLSLAMYYAYKGDTEKTIAHMKLFAKQDNYMYWTLLFLKIDPLIDPVKDNTEFQQLLQEIETKFWQDHQRIKESLEEKGLL
ncbi:MAG: helix-turn-helix domain-containing protein [Bacteroidales bacterium]|nr:helix-turn-helix domain-containing protein [Bacteroidales bacterium]